MPITPPEVVTHVDARYPPSALKARQHADVVLAVTVDADGHVSKVEVLHSGGADLDEAAVIAARQWTFVPAKRANEPVASRIRVPFHFAPPAPPPELVEPKPSEEPKLSGESSAAARPGGVSAAAGPQGSAHGGAAADVTIAGSITAQSHGASDLHIPIGALRAVPRGNASEYLKLAPGILLTNEGGEGHAEQVFLRGFDAREGQDIEFSVDGIPVNDSGNIHGNGYADTHFILPELIQELHVTEGPFSPYQGNYAVAGSADFHLGLDRRGITTKLTYGSWNTQRLLLLWGPPGASGRTFGGAEAFRSDGFGDNRASSRGTAMGQYEVELGSGSSLRVGGQAYANHFLSAGVIRQDDYASGRVAFDGTRNSLQGGDAARFSLYANYLRTGEGSAFEQSLFLIRRNMRLEEDFTGFLQDTQRALDTLHNQRGDLIDLQFDAWTLGGRGVQRLSREVMGLKQSLDVGYVARADLTHGTQYRNTVPGNIPYRLETDLTSTLTDIGLFADASLRPHTLLTFRGGIRADVFSYDVLNGCAAQGDFDHPSRTNPPTNESCHDQMQNAIHREPVQRSSTGATKIMPRGTVIVGPFGHFNISLSYGKGVRSIDPSYIAQNLDTPFASVTAYEGAATYAHDFGAVDVSARSVFFQTKVDRDLVFSQTAGRNVLADGTTRTGWSGSTRLRGDFFDQAANITLVRPTFDDTHLQIPYVPTLVVREDLALFQELPWRLAHQSVKGTLGVGWTYVGKRALPYNQLSDVISVVDASGALEMGGWELSLSVTNLFDRKYRLGEYNYASDFHSQPEPTLVPARHFVAGAPRGLFLSLARSFGGA